MEQLDDIERGPRIGVPGGSTIFLPEAILEDPLTPEEAAFYEALLGKPSFGQLPKANGAGPRVMVVEDHAEVRELIVEILKGWGLAVIECADGAEALKRLCETRIDLLLIDLRLPAMNGFKVIRGIRSYLKLFDLVIVAISALAKTNYETAALNIGADAFLRKPFTRAQISAHLKPIVRRLCDPRRP